MNILVSPWIVVGDHCAVRILAGTEFSTEHLWNRVAFIEKTPRVRIGPCASRGNFSEQHAADRNNWEYGPKGTGGSGDHEQLGQYGFDPHSREWCDTRLREIGYELT